MRAAGQPQCTRYAGLLRCTNGQHPFPQVAPMGVHWAVPRSVSQRRRPVDQDVNRFPRRSNIGRVGRLDH
jgi:hypothetical protein